MRDCCKYCGVSTSHSHMDWCKQIRPPSASELAQEVIRESQSSVGYEGPSDCLRSMAEALLKADPPAPVTDLSQPTLIYRGMPQGAQITACVVCGWTYGTHSPDCPHSQESV